MAKRKKTVKPPRPAIDPETGLPPVGKGTPLERERVLARARAKHAPRHKRA